MIDRAISKEDRIRQIEDVIFNASTLYRSPHVIQLVTADCRTEINRLERGGDVALMPLSSMCPTAEEADGVLLRP